MHPILTDFKKLLLYLISWLIAGAFMATMIIVAGHSQWINAFFFALPVTLAFGFVAASAYYICKAFPMSKRGLVEPFFIFGGTSVVSGFFMVGLCQIWNNLGISIGADWSSIEIPQKLIILLFGAGAGMYLLSILAHDALITFENNQQLERREFESRLQARDAELQMLRTQIEPHFLFNSLNSISALTSKDPSGAREMTIALAQFFRKSLVLSEKKKITLIEEILLCQNYLNIERVRFGEKLKTQFEIDEHSKNYMIPPLILQPLIENAIKHGIRDLVDGGLIFIKSRAYENTLYLVIENPVDENPSSSPGNGLGLKNIRERFKTIYGDKARISWIRREEKFSVELILPYETER